MTRRWKSPLGNSQRKARKGSIGKAAICALEPLERRLVLSASLALSGTQTITPGTVHDVSNTASPEHEFEMSVAINPTNPLNVVGVSVRRDANDLDWKIDIYGSTDGGASWASPVEVDDVGDGHPGGVDPSIAFDANGVLYVSFIHSYAAALVVLKSTDGGSNFSVKLNEFQSGIDKDSLTTGLDPTTGNQAVYVTYVSSSQFWVVGSNDGGENFVTKRVDPGLGEGGDFAEPAVGPNGELYISWEDSYSYEENDVSYHQILMDKDTDGLWGTNDAIDDSDSNIVVLHSNALIQQWGLLASPNRIVWGAPTIDVDESTGKIYIAFVQSDGDSHLDIAIVSSTNGGSSWSSPATVDAGTGTDDFLPGLAVDQTSGSVNVAFLTTAGTGSVYLAKPRLSTSIDGGANFVSADLSSAPSDERGGSALEYGEYLGLAVRDGTAQALWARGDSNGLNDGYSTSSSFASATSNNVLTINGDDSGSATVDTILVRRNATNTAFLEVMVNNVRQFCGLYASVSKIVINGLGGNDTIAVDSGVSLPVTINGGDANDSLVGGSGNDSITGGAGNDTLVGGAGNDTLDGGADTNRVDYSGSPSAVNISVDGVANDSDGLGGTDQVLNVKYVIGSPGNDTLSGGSSSVWLQGGGGNDSLVGSSVNDTLWGQNGNDVLRGGAGDDQLSGGNGDDTLDGGTGDDGIEGDAGADVVDYSARTAPVVVTLDSDVNGESGEADAIYDVEACWGGSGSDTLAGDAFSTQAVTLKGNAGDDSLTGGPGDDLLDGGTGNDILLGGAGNDTLVGGAGSDYMSGDDGSDLYFALDGEVDTLHGVTGSDSYLKDDSDVLN